MKNKSLALKIIERVNLEPGLILLHHNADIDALGSAIAFRNAYPGYSIGAFQNISQLSKKLLKYYDDIIIMQPPKIDQYKTVVILDASTPSQLGISQEVLDNPIVIDHHLFNDIWETRYYYCDPSKTSCAEIIYEFLKLTNFKFDQKTALALLVAILADTGHFKYANYDSLINFANLLKLGKLTVQEVLDVLDMGNEINISQRIAHLKGAQRSKFTLSNGYIIAISQISSYEASMCKNLLALGADLAFVGAQRGEQIRISGRASAELVDNGLHLGKFFQKLGYELSCEGGGHAGAAGVNGTGDVEMVLNACVDGISKMLKKRQGNE